MIFLMLAQLVLAIVHGISRDIKVGGPCFCITVLFFLEKESSRNLSARRSPHGVGSRCQPARALVRAVTATKHEPGLSPSCRVVSCGSAMEVWVLLV